MHQGSVFAGFSSVATGSLIQAVSTTVVGAPSRGLPTGQPLLRSEAGGRNDSEKSSLVSASIRRRPLNVVRRRIAMQTQVQCCPRQR